MKPKKHPSKAYRAKMKTVLEPSLVGKMLAGFKQQQPTKGYEVCRVDGIANPEALVHVKRFKTKTEAEAYQRTLPYNTTIVKAKAQRKK